MEDGILIGAHTSAAGGSFNALKEGASIGATTIQLFTSNQKQWKGRSISEEEVAHFKKMKEETGISSIMSHDSYLINLGSIDPLLLQKSRDAFQAELERCHLLDIQYLNFHPGAHTKGSLEECLEKIAESLLLFEKLASKGSTKLLLEATAGQGTSVGHRFEHLAYIIQRVKGKIPIGVCIDTCHIFAAGYDIRTKEAWEKTLMEFDRVIGLEFLSAFHLNDSQKEIASRVDRHASLGKGKIGIESFNYLMRHKNLKKLPMYLETPEGPPMWKEEIAHLKKIAQEKETAAL